MQAPYPKIPLTEATNWDTLNRDSNVYTPDHAFDWVYVAKHYWEIAFRNSCARGGRIQLYAKFIPLQARQQHY